jgi:hypothetical protein
MQAPKVRNRVHEIVDHNEFVVIRNEVEDRPVLCDAHERHVAGGECAPEVPQKGDAHDRISQTTGPDDDESRWDLQLGGYLRFRRAQSGSRYDNEKQKTSNRFVQKTKVPALHSTDFPKRGNCSRTLSISSL